MNSAALPAVKGLSFGRTNGRSYGSASRTEPLERGPSPEAVKLLARAAAFLGLPVECLSLFAEKSIGPDDLDFGGRLEILGLVQQPPRIETIEDWCRAGLDAETLATILATCRVFPITDGTRSFGEYLVGENELSEEGMKALRIGAIQRNQSPVEHLIDQGQFKTNPVLTHLKSYSGVKLGRRCELDGHAAVEHPEAARAALTLDVVLWRTKGGQLIALTERPTLDAALEAIATRVDDDSFEVRLVSPRSFGTRRAKVTAALAQLPEEAVSVQDASEGVLAIQPTLASTTAAGDTASRPLQLSVEVPRIRSEVLSPIEAPWMPNIPTAEAVTRILKEARDQRATDIHFDPRRDHLRIRVRVDGMLRDFYRVRPDMQRQLMARTKIMADLDITERRRPQDGHIRAIVDGVSLDMRVATIPVKHGERLELRLANQAHVKSDLSGLGLLGTSRQLVERFLRQPHGIVLATGPVGSGKTTSLYSCLSQLDHDRFNIMSIEDPVEVDIDGVNQVNVSYKVGVDFVQGLRALLRHDPDILLVGEVRDEETARIAIRAAMTGMLVFSSLHTNDAPGAITTLYNFRLPPHLVASALLGVVAQRLVRQLCPHCSQRVEASEEDLEFLFRGTPDRPDSVIVQTPVGCDECAHTGFHGRIGVFEVLAVSSSMRAMILAGSTEAELREHAISEGMISLHADARAKVLDGTTSVEEVARVLGF